MKTLVVKLAGVVDDSSLKRFGELQMSVASVASPTADTQKIRLNGQKALNLEITGNGYFTDSNLTANLGKKLTVQPRNVGNNTEVYLSNGSYTVSILNKYDVVDFRVNKNRSLTMNIKDLADMINLKHLYIDDFPGITGDIENLSQLVNLITFAVANNSRRLYGNITAFAGMTSAEAIYMQWMPAIVGTTGSLAHLHPDNGGKLTIFRYLHTVESGGVEETDGVTWPQS